MEKEAPPEKARSGIYVDTDLTPKGYFPPLPSIVQHGFLGFNALRFDDSIRAYQKSSGIIPPQNRLLKP